MKPSFVQAPNLCQQFPSPTYSFFLKVVSKGPITQHLEECVVVGVPAHIFQVIVFSTGPDAFLRISCSIVIACSRAKKDVLELVHTRIGKKQCWVIIRYNWGAAHKSMLTFFKEAYEFLTDLLGCLHGRLLESESGKEIPTGQWGRLGCRSYRAMYSTTRWSSTWIGISSRAGITSSFPVILDPSLSM